MSQNHDSIKLLLNVVTEKEYGWGNSQSCNIQIRFNENQVHSEHKGTIMHGPDHYNTTILSIIHNMSTTCFGHHQVGYNYRRKLHST